jgi:TRAP-type C4-dicarboxylate transport system permease small subunit
MANPRLPKPLALLDRGVAGCVRASLFLVVPVSLLLFLQWPLRELLQAYSRQANDFAQVLFALYVAVAVTAATRRGAHLAADTLARRYPPAVRRRLWRGACIAILIPWSLFVLYAGASGTWLAVTQLERFQDTLDPGYFVIRIAALALATLVLAQAIIDLASRGDTAED